MEIVEESVAFNADGATMEGVLAYPADVAPVARWLLLCPHPQMGGRMDNNVIRTLARRGAETGRATLRFNYRGVGGSEILLAEGASVFDHWATLERERAYELLAPDVLAAHAFLRTLAVETPFALIGYSLGAILAGMYANTTAADQVVAIAPPSLRVPLTMFAKCAAPLHFLTGETDFAFDEAGFAAQFAALPQPKTQTKLHGADHFFRGGEEALFLALEQTLASMA